uniref:Uncharacterized protein n=1 Tax=Aegilops tauschii subsp. strangulata TaxID=200361 RepID=A0A452Y2Y7_AEGTS
VLLPLFLQYYSFILLDERYYCNDVLLFCNVFLIFFCDCTQWCLQVHGHCHNGHLIAVYYFWISYSSRRAIL